MDEEYLLVKKSEIDSLLTTVQHNTFYETVKACYEHWNFDIASHTYPPPPPLNTRMKTGQNQFFDKYLWNQ